MDARLKRIDDNDRIRDCDIRKPVKFGEVFAAVEVATGIAPKYFRISSDSYNQEFIRMSVADEDGAPDLHVLVSEKNLKRRVSTLFRLIDLRERYDLPFMVPEPYEVQYLRDDSISVMVTPESGALSYNDAIDSTRRPSDWFRLGRDVGEFLSWLHTADPAALLPPKRDLITPEESIDHWVQQIRDACNGSRGHVKAWANHVVESADLDFELTFMHGNMTGAAAQVMYPVMDSLFIVDHWNNSQLGVAAEDIVKFADWADQLVAGRRDALLAGLLVGYGLDTGEKIANYIDSSEFKIASLLRPVVDRLTQRGRGPVAHLDKYMSGDPIGRVLTMAGETL